jgi:site-specific recombinase XerD
MDKSVVVHPQVLCWLRESILDSHVATFLIYLRDHGYAKQTRHSYLCAAGHFARWLSLEKARLSQLDEQVVRRFLSIHLPHCSCPYPVLRTKHEIHAALRHLLAALRAGGVIQQRQDADPVSLELAHFDRYMLHVRGLAISTRRQRVLIIRKFLLAQRLNKHFEIGRISANDVRVFVLSGYGKFSAGTVGVVGGALRCYLRFRAMEGDNIEHLREAVPSAAHWRLAGVPELLSDQEVRALLNSFSKLEHSPKRAYAMVRCLTDLGLRASEVAHLRLEDIDWKKGTILLPMGKLRRGSVLPLTEKVGQAITDYLRKERPRTSNRAVFVRHVAPYDVPIGSGVVRRAVREAYQRCGLAHSRVHILRHSMASRLLSQGAPLKEIADVLRHRSLDTSMIYTKVDLRRLVAVALPWPGRQL